NDPKMIGYDVDGDDSESCCDGGQCKASNFPQDQVPNLDGSHQTGYCAKFQAGHVEPESSKP
ncbi:MAG: hypothetical protein EBX72_13035, partial [Betaproteobacteria bacterium]|nr:hypothetical protein [Betaproteobacteria bacterium]